MFYKLHLGTFIFFNHLRLFSAKSFVLWYKGNFCLHLYPEFSIIRQHSQKDIKCVPEHDIEILWNKTYIPLHPTVIKILNLLDH